jgi:parallel beta-helix repeat protein
MNVRTRLVTPVAALTLIAAAGFLIAGPLDPPAGPISPTFKTLTEVEPRTAINASNTPGDADSLYKITQPGSYYLTGNITGVAAKHGVEIVASGVTLDLSGFELLGVPGSLDGVSATVGVNNVQVRNGSVRSWGDEGLDFTNGGSISITDVSVLSCAGFGISINPNSAATRCKVNSNGAGGIATGSNCVVTGCTAQGNTGGGILAWVGCTVVDCAAMTNTGNGISANNGSTITGCTATDSTASGFSVANGCTVSNCTASNNDVHGIVGIDGVVVSACTVRANFQNGIVLGTSAAVENCTARSNTGVGISCGSGTVTSCTAALNAVGISIANTTARGCSANNNTGDGILAGEGCQIIDNHAEGNVGDGIEASSFCLIRGNTCYVNGSGGDGAGIHITGIFNRIEGNTCTRADRGIDVDAQANIIIRNTCGFNGVSWTIAANNDLAPIVFASTNAAPVNGTSYAGNLGSTDPNANFTMQ